MSRDEEQRIARLRRAIAAHKTDEQIARMIAGLERRTAAPEFHQPIQQRAYPAGCNPYPFTHYSYSAREV